MFSTNLLGQCKSENLGNLFDGMEDKIIFNLLGELGQVFEIGRRNNNLAKSCTIASNTLLFEATNL